jgi:hypothetical protein
MPATDDTPAQATKMAVFARTFPCLTKPQA